MSAAILELDHIGQRCRGRKIGVRTNEACFVVFHARDHSGLALDRLRTIDEGDAALLRKRDGHLVIRNGLHDSGNHGDRKRDGGFFALLELNEWSFQTYRLGNAIG